jgi:uncharacterized protein YndB with AHSA1/START domain
MMTVQPASALDTLRLTHFLPAARDRVFHAWTAPDELKEWFEPDAHRVEEAALALTVGGAYRVSLCKDDARIVLSGAVIALDPPHRLEMSWSVAGADCDHGRHAQLSLAFAEKGAATELVLVQGPIPTASRAPLEAWWRQCFELLGEYLGREGRRETVEPYR